ncbi:oligopeptide transport ATP-binding protein OppF [Salmonella enterica subsp. enterica serovar Typhimurium]|nr:oligopeptide transport ATP-binding protein OppF [Salmonella enterica subsp. enterica serovar Typhimurium]
MNAVIEQRKVLLEIADLKVHFDIKEGKQWFWQPPKTLKAVDGVTLRLYEGETLGVVGESGCGKSTFARAIIGLVKATDGKVAWLGKDLLGMKADEWRRGAQRYPDDFPGPAGVTQPANDDWRNYR